MAVRGRARAAPAPASLAPLVADLRCGCRAPAGVGHLPPADDGVIFPGGPGRDIRHLVPDPGRGAGAGGNRLRHHGVDTPFHIRRGDRSPPSRRVGHGRARAASHPVPLHRRGQTHRAGRVSAGGTGGPSRQRTPRRSHQSGARPSRAERRDTARRGLVGTPTAGAGRGAHRRRGAGVLRGRVRSAARRPGSDIVAGRLGVEGAIPPPGLGGSAAPGHDRDQRCRRTVAGKGAARDRSALRGPGRRADRRGGGGGGGSR